MSKSQDHVAESTKYAHVDTPAMYTITAGTLDGDDGVVHFPLPFRQWYDDLIHT